MNIVSTTLNIMVTVESDTDFVKYHNYIACRLFESEFPNTFTLFTLVIMIILL